MWTALPVQANVEEARKKAPGQADVKREGEALVEQTKEGLVHAKDVAVDSAKYIAGRFTAPISGDERTDEQKARPALLPCCMSVSCASP